MTLKRAGKQPADILLFLDGLLQQRIGAVAVGLGSQALAVGDEDVVAAGRNPHRGRIPADRQEARASGSAHDAKHRRRPHCWRRRWQSTACCRWAPGRGCRACCRWVPSGKATCRSAQVRGPSACRGRSRRCCRRRQRRAFLRRAKEPSPLDATRSARWLKLSVGQGRSPPPPTCPRDSSTIDWSCERQREDRDSFAPEGRFAGDRPRVRTQDEEPVAETTGGVDTTAVEAAGKARGDRAPSCSWEARLPCGRRDNRRRSGIRERRRLRRRWRRAVRRSARSTGRKRSSARSTLETMRRVVTSTTTIACGP